MSHSNCIFCKIIAHEIPAQKILENDDIIVIKDIAPKAPIHCLIIPKKHIADIRSFEQDDLLLAGKMMFAAQTLSSQLSQTNSTIPFRLIVNNGADAGQHVFHLHLHFLSGRLFTDF